MTLSIDKLISLLEKKGFIIRKYYIQDGYCRFIEILSISTIDRYIISISDKYQFVPRTSDAALVYKIKSIPIIKSDNISEKYAGRLEENKIAENYDEIELKSQYPYEIENCEDVNMEVNLTNQYKRPIILKDVAETDNGILQDIFRQLKRLLYCVKFLKYRFCIIYKSYIAVLHQDETIECFRIKKFQEVDQRDLYITIDLEVFYENSRVLQDDLDQLQNGIRSILDKNQEVQVKHLENMIEKQYQIIKIINKINQQKLMYRQDLEKFKALFLKVDDNINLIINKINSLNQNIQITNNEKQAALIKEKTLVYRKLTELYSKKEVIATAIIDIRKSEHSIALNTDRLLFDNNVMLDKIFKNLINLNDLLK